MLKKNKIAANNNEKDQKSRLCPLIGEACLKTDCALYYSDFEKCLIEVLNWNLYALKKTIENQ